MEVDEIDHALESASQLKVVLDDLEARSRSFGSAITSALKGAVLEGDSLTEVLQGIASRFSSISLDAGMKPLENSLTSMFSGLTSSLSNAVGFANGGVVDSPTHFAMAGGQAGVMGEAGAEAIMPLRRGPDGRLGVAGAGDGGPIQVVFNVQAADAQSFRRSEGQINAMLTRAVGRGRRGI
ncbi:phage tail tape measure protein [Rhizobium sp. KVB221]|uniref:Phage tail tape measure protein n=1 Tax=Rhizobium setariae TaxID=2801340 RepID=A0A937CNU7_9HYPH|nr:phage tail tape measure protein [Rhizobium setariae]MBL0371077.1 phage tail tape measure protein [Rhizobium setariae]